jgi:hypothetical protein
MNTSFRKLAFTLAVLTMGFGSAVSVEARASNTSGSTLSGLALTASVAGGSMVIQGSGEFVVKAVRPIAGGVALILVDSGTGATELLKVSGDGIGALGKLAGQTVSFVAGASGTIIASGDEVVAFISHPRSRHLLRSTRYRSGK